MGNNYAYTVMEATVVGAYNLGVLDKNLLGVLLEPYRDSDIDSGGSEDLRSKDGKSVEEIIITVSGGKIPKHPDVPANYDDQTQEQRDQMDDYHEKLHEEFFKATKKYGW